MLTYKIKKRIRLILINAVLIAACIAILFPLLWTLRTSLAYRVLAYKIPPKWFFIPTLENYKIIFQNHPFPRFFINSFVVALLSTAVCLILGAPAAFSYSRFRTGGDILRVSMLATQMLPAITLVIPFFLILNKINLYNTRFGLIVTYITFNIPFVVWILISFFEGVPKELEESAMVDGCSRFNAFLRIIIPISLPGMLSAGVFCFVLSWNDYWN